MTRHKLTNMTQIALSTGLICILSQIAFPTLTGVPITLQTFIIAFLGYLLLPKQALTAVFLYLLLGAVGVPVFANFKAGLPHLLNLTGGFLFGMLPLTLFCSLSGMFKPGISSQPMQRVRVIQTIFRLLGGFLGLAVFHILGVLQYAYLSNQSFYTSFLLVSAPYLWKDVICIIVAAIIARPAKVILARFI